MRRILTRLGVAILDPMTRFIDQRWGHQAACPPNHEGLMVRLFIRGRDRLAETLNLHGDFGEEE